MNVLIFLRRLRMRLKIIDLIDINLINKIMVYSIG